MLNQKTHIILLFGLLTGTALGQTAGMLAFQGVIRDDQRALLDGPVDLTFRVFDAEVAGNQVDITGDGIVDAADTKEVVNVAVVAGAFSTKFGPVSPGTFDGSARFLEVSVDGQVLSRIEMVSTAPEPQGGTLPSDDLVLQTPTTELRLDAVSGAVTVTGEEGITATKMRVLSAGASVAGTGGVAELAVNVDGDLELTVDGAIVDRWTGLGETGTIFGVSPNRISGSFSNTVAADIFGAVIGGGGGSTGFGNRVDGVFGTIGGGIVNVAGDRGTVAGGDGNDACGIGASVGGGFDNTASGGFWATIPGGAGNVASGNFSFAAGAECVASEQGTHAIGFRAQATQPGMFVWSDSNQADDDVPVFPAATESKFTPAGNQFLARTRGGAVFVTAIDGSGNSTAGVQLAAGGGSWASLSDRNAKENFAPVNTREALEKVAAMPVSTWNYKSQDPSIRHIGPMAQDLHAAFGVGEKETMITAIDADGVALAAIQGLYELVLEKDCEITDLESRNDELEERLTRLERILGRTTTR